MKVAFQLEREILITASKHRTPKPVRSSNSCLGREVWVGQMAALFNPRGSLEMYSCVLKLIAAITTPRKLHISVCCKMLTCLLLNSFCRDEEQILQALRIEKRG